MNATLNAAPEAAKGAAPVGVVLVNWNRWADTIEALESLLRSTVPVRVVVVDNASADGSFERIAAWAAGREPAAAASAPMARLSTPALAKPIALRRIAPDEAGTAELGAEDWLTLVDSGGNLGFAGGNNVGLRLLQTDPAVEIFWLLNNDTVVEADTAALLGARMLAEPRVGMCGTVVRYYWHPDRVQALNGHRLSWWTGTSKGINHGLSPEVAFDARQVARETDFVLGASLAVSRAFLETVGPMEESYFLYFEEADWAARNAGRFGIGFAAGAVVFHKEGGSIGSSGVPGARSEMSDYWLARSRLAFIRRHRPLLWPWHWLFSGALMARRLVRGQPAKAKSIWKAMTE
ncbi:rhamnosyltransferase [Polymorphobacter glacialis]|uniref:Rhamnosyltransferase n=1 Tax=Sandarakinorhabdus glacialis TaxID=1614636 RepID=A0A916ZJD0_9SPHN|nr:glycosyltransferase family 2 protein [Polymorphobacter glacialis]GGE00120.1 rhamnosyltransferase [Polymorphobacter glacialis]